jgi:hypothetical protein
LLERKEEEFRQTKNNKRKSKQDQIISKKRGKERKVTVLTKTTAARKLRAEEKL